VIVVLAFFGKAKDAGQEVVCGNSPFRITIKVGSFDEAATKEGVLRGSGPLRNGEL
jgi:hypothetical protein